MNVIRVVKTINSNDIHINGLDKFLGKNAEIIILIESSEDDALTRRDKAFKLINSYSGKIMKWSRKDIYE